MRVLSFASLHNFVPEGVDLACSATYGAGDSAHFLRAIGQLTIDQQLRFIPKEA
jgi:hypothetical protein